MYIITHKRKKTVWTSFILVDLWISQRSECGFALPHFNSSKVVPTTVVSLCFFTGCRPKFSGNKDNMIGRLRTMTTTK